MIPTTASRAARAAAPMYSHRLALAGLLLGMVVLPGPGRGQAPDPAPETEAAALQLDPAHSRFGFELRTRWGQHIVGNFPRHEVRITALPDGRRQVRIRLASQSVEVSGSPRYARFASGPNFLDAGRHPWVEFLSEPYPGDLLHAGGPLRGTLSLHGVTRAETFTVKPADCDRPGHGCDVVASGRINRVDYGLESWRWAVADEVRFTLRVRWMEEGQ